MSRNRQQRRSTTVYQLEPVFVSKGHSVLDKSTQYYIEGDELEGCVIVSVPNTTTHAACRELEQQLQKTLKKTVLIFTHNVKFLKAKKLDSTEGAKVIRQIERTAEGNGVAA